MGIALLGGKALSLCSCSPFITAAYAGGHGANVIGSRAR